MTKHLISKVAITPDVFEDSLYEDPFRFRVGIANLFRGLEATGLVANMDGGEWIRFVKLNLGGSRPEVTKLLKVLVERERLVTTPRAALKESSKYEDWLDEAVELLRRHDVQGVISTQEFDASRTNAVHPNDLDGLREQPSWWIDDPTEKLQATIRCNVKDYCKVLHPILVNSSKIVFYDKFLDPSAHRFRNFGKLLALCAHNAKRQFLRIELHRTIPHVSDPDAMMSEKQWRSRFAPLNYLVSTYGLRIQVSIWNPRTLQHGKHPRFVLSKVGSFSFDKGFGEDDVENNLVLFMGRTESQRWERNFDQNVSQPKFTFTLPA